MQLLTSEIATMWMNLAYSSSKWLQCHAPRRTFRKAKRQTKASDTADSATRRKSRSYWDRRLQACHGPKPELVENQTGLYPRRRTWIGRRVLERRASMQVRFLRLDPLQYGPGSDSFVI